MGSALESLLAQTFGSALIGAMVAMVLYGIGTMQTYLYFVYYPEDSRGLKALVSVLWVVETLHVAFVNRFLYIYLIMDFGNPLALIKGHWTLYISILCNLIVVIIAQTFFATRIHALAKKYWLTGIIGLCILAHIAFGIETVVRSFQHQLFTDLAKYKFNTVLPLGLFSVVPDVLISASLCYYLKSNRDQITGIKSTEIVIDLLIKYAINRVLLTSACAIAELVMSLTLPDSFSYLALDFCVGKLYSNTLLATLNARKYLRAKGTDVVVSGSPDNRQTFGTGIVYATPGQAQMSLSTRSQGVQSIFDGYQINSLGDSGLTSDSTNTKFDAVV